MKTTLIPALLISALCAGPATAQVIDDSPETAIITAPRAGDSLGRAYDIPFDQRIGHRTMLAPNSMTRGSMIRMEGKAVMGYHGEQLGTVLTVDHGQQLAEVQTPGGVSVAMPIVLLEDKGDRLFAPTTSRREMDAMAMRQTGTTVAFDFGTRSGFRG